jgi:DNA-binding PadR family transcriptional regulator
MSSASRRRAASTFIASRCSGGRRHAKSRMVENTGPQHGYGIMTDVSQISGGRVRLRAGTLYAALNRLAAERLVEFDREEIVDARLRRYYRLTPQGAQRLETEVDRMRSNTAVAARRLRLLGGTP